MIETAWAAGFFDGEGNTAVQWKRNKNGTRRGYLRMSITQNRREPLDRFHAAVGGLGQVGGPYDRPRDKNPHYRWQVDTAQAEAVIAQLYPLLSVPKREQIDDKKEAIARNIQDRQAA